MSVIDRYRSWFEQEKDSNRRMLEMITSVPANRRNDPRFAQALRLAAHLAACRENWLDRMASGGQSQADWWPAETELESLAPRFEKVEAAWTAYLASLEDCELDMDFDFPTSTGTYRWNIEGQLMQLVGHAFYHRGQIALLVDQLGGKTVDTDYLYWAFERQPERWKKLHSGSSSIGPA